MVNIFSRSGKAVKCGAALLLAASVLAGGADDCGAQAFRPAKRGDAPGAGFGQTTGVPMAAAATAEVSAAKPETGATAGTSEIPLAPQGAISYQQPSGAAASVEVHIEKLTLAAEELPESLALATVSKMKTNPHIATSQNDMSKIAKEAFRNKVSPANWRVAHTSFFSGKEAHDDTVYMIIAIEYKTDASPDAFRRDVSALKQYLKKEASDEYVIIEKFPFLVITGSNQAGDYEFSVTRDIAERLKFKIFGAAAVSATPVTYDPAAQPAPPAVPAAPAPSPVQGQGTSETTAVNPGPPMPPMPPMPGGAPPAKTETLKTEVISEITTKEAPDAKAAAAPSASPAPKTDNKPPAATAANAAGNAGTTATAPAAATSETAVKAPATKPAAGDAAAKGTQAETKPAGTAKPMATPADATKPAAADPKAAAGTPKPATDAAKPAAEAKPSGDAAKAKTPAERILELRKQLEKKDQTAGTKASPTAKTPATADKKPAAKKPSITEDEEITPDAPGE